MNCIKCNKIINDRNQEYIQVSLKQNYQSQGYLDTFTKKKTILCCSCFKGLKTNIFEEELKVAHKNNPKYILRPNDFEVFSINEDGTYSVEAQKKQFPNSLFQKFTRNLLLDCNFLEVKDSVLEKMITDNNLTNLKSLMDNILGKNND